MLELHLSLPPYSTSSISLQFNRAHLKWTEHKPDAHHGFYVKLTHTHTHAHTQSICFSMSLSHDSSLSLSPSPSVVLLYLQQFSLTVTTVPLSPQKTKSKPP